MDVVLRATAIFLALWIATRGMGKRQLAEMSPFDLILLVIMGDLVQQGITQDDRSVFGALLAVGTITLLVIFSSWLTFRSSRAKSVVIGLPLVVMRDGQTIDEALKAERLTPDELEQQARNIGIEDLKNVKIAILEPEGQFSFVLNNGKAIGQKQRKMQQPSVD
jgi:uncharacterized membrane protein YcaP (DUF421 family)